MDTVVFDGNEYTKASVLAEKFRYTQDYLGQLCRAKKVDARLVGRAWYVNLDSLMTHRDSRYKAPLKPAEITPKKAINNYLSRIDVEPILKNKTVKVFKNERGVLSELAMKYEVDDHALIPRVHKQAVSVNLQINQADAEMLKVQKKNKEEINFKPEPLPEVYLRGTLTVKGLLEPMEEPVLETKPEPVKEFVRPVALASQPTQLVRPKIITIRKVRRAIPALSPAVARKVESTPARTVEMIRPHPVVIPVPISVPIIISSTPLVAAPAPLQQPKVSVIPVSEATPVTQTPQFRPALIIAKEATLNPLPALTPAGLFAPVSMVVTAFALGALIIATSVEVLASGNSYDAHFVIQAANLVSVYDRLPW